MHCQHTAHVGTRYTDSEPWSRVVHETETGVSVHDASDVSAVRLLHYHGSGRSLAQGWPRWCVCGRGIPWSLATSEGTKIPTEIWVPARNEVHIAGGSWAVSMAAYVGPCSACHRGSPGESCPLLGWGEGYIFNGDRVRCRQAQVRCKTARDNDFTLSCSGRCTLRAGRGLILTNRHVVTDGPVTMEAVFKNKEEVVCQPLYRDPGTFVACDLQRA